MTSAEELTEIERKMWTNEVDIYEATYLPDAVLVFAETSRIDLATALAALPDEGEKGERWAEVNFDDVRVLELGTDAAVLTCTATARWNYEDEPWSPLLDVCHEPRASDGNLNRLLGRQWQR